jgi:hypothetical protein
MAKEMIRHGSYLSHYLHHHGCNHLLNERKSDVDGGYKGVWDEAGRQVLTSQLD